MRANTDASVCICVNVYVVAQAATNTSSNSGKYVVPITHSVEHSVDYSI